ncbi:MAG: sigma-70 family RNA polymerase sigma factor [Anaerolineae bacterium]|nr:sigma-70 family RNA polymerase sigma factor [Anaerolineae bacterium]
MSHSEALLEGLRQGDEVAFETIFRTYYGRVFALAYRLLGSAQEAEDVAQETFLRLYLRPLPRGREHNLLAWLLKVATNLGYNAARARRRRQVKEEMPATANTSEPDPADQAMQADRSGHVREVLAHLPERQVQILLLRHVGLSYEELATALGVAPGSVGTLLARAERAFQQRYSELEEK